MPQSLFVVSSSIVLISCLACTGSATPVQGNDLSSQTAAQAPPNDLSVGVNKSNILENQNGVKRLSIANPEIAEAVAVSKTEVLINGKMPGDTSLVLWDLNNQRTMFDIHVLLSDTRPEAIRDQLHRELAGQDVSFTVSNGSVFLSGTADDLTSASRALALVSTLGKVVNLLKVKVPDAEPQILLKVKFANVDRSMLQQLGFNLVSTGATNTIGGTTTGQFGGQPSFDFTKNPVAATFGGLLNVFLLRQDLNLAAEIQALQQQQVLEILAEPNLLTLSGHPANFLAGGEFPFPTLQGGGGGVGQVTIQFREFGVRIHFLPTVTPRGTIRLSVTPEVSSLDYANGLNVGGFTVPGLAVRRIQTEVELQTGQSFVIGGLLDNRTTENLSKIPGLGDIPLLGKLFQSRQISKTNTELLVLVTPEIVRPVPAGVTPPDVKMPKEFLKGTAPAAPQSPVDKGAKLPVAATMPIEVLKAWTDAEEAAGGTDSTSGMKAAPLPVAPLPAAPQPAAPQPAAPGGTVQPPGQGNSR